MGNTYLSEQDHIVRYVSSSRIKHDDDNRPIGFFPQAFILRNDEEYLSASWLEYFSGDRPYQLQQTVQALENEGITIRKSGALSINNVGAFKDTCLKHDSKVRIIHEPYDKNPAYAAIRNYPKDSAQLFALIANDAELVPITALRSE